MSGFHIPRWLDLILTAGDKAHKAVHPSRWGEGKPCECGKQDGRVRPVVLVLLAVLAVIAWFCRDILFLLYVLATGGFGH